VTTRYARTATVAAIAAVALVGTACSSSSKSASSSPAATTSAAAASTSASASPTPTPVTGTIVVLAASSLTGTFNTLVTQFEAANPGAKVMVTYGSSGTLATQITQGAPADVFASAAPANMQSVITAGGASTSTNFVKNSMEIATPPSNPANVTALADLAKSSVKVAICVATAPCGVVAAQVFTNAAITVKPVTMTTDDKATLTAIEANQVDAGMVYTTDVLAAAAAVKGIQIPDNVNATTEYPIAALTKAANPAGAAAWVAYVLSPAGQSVFSAAGFEAP
jgi:molybdate transport system substrate-binding protein